MVKRLLCILFLINSCLLIAQDYYSHVFNLEENPYPNLTQLIVDDDIVYITSLNVIEDISSSMIMKLDLNSLNYNYILIDSFKITRKGLQILNEDLICFGDTKHDLEKVQVLKLTKNIQLDTIYIYETSSLENLAFCFTSDRSYSYGVSTDKFNEGDHQETHIKKFDQNGNVLWSNNYGVEDKWTFTYEIAKSHDDQLLFGTDIVQNEISGQYSRLYKIDTLGNVVWKYTDMEPSDDFFAKQHIAPLKNHETIMITRLDKRQDLEYTINDWFPLPSKMSWIDQNGNLVRDTVINSPFLNQLIIRDVLDGKGDYFFAFGIWIDPVDDNKFGWILKIAYDGTVIWNRRYRAPHFEHIRSQFFDDITELENGNILALGTIEDLDKNQIWLLRLNEHGCLGDEDCGEVPFTTSTETVINSTECNVFPNPSSGNVSIKLNNPVFYNNSEVNVSILDAQGTILKFFKNLNSKNIQLDLSTFETGTYFLKIQYVDNTKEFVIKKVSISRP